MIGHTGDAVVLSDTPASSVEEKPLMKISENVTNLPVASTSDSQEMLYCFDSDGLEEPCASGPCPSMVQPLADFDRKEQVMLLDEDDEASSLQMPCLIPESPPTSSLQSQNDQRVSDAGIPADAAVDGNVPDGSVQEPSHSPMFHFLRPRAPKKADRQLQNLAR